jgi:CheY-like chemotaxis protein
VPVKQVENATKRPMPPQCASSAKSPYEECDISLVAGTAARLDKAFANSASLDFDLAVIDVNLNGVGAYPLAEVLVNRGIPVLFVTGYGEFGVPDKFRCIPVLSKPFQPRDLERALAKALASMPGSGADASEPSPI